MTATKAELGAWESRYGEGIIVNAAEFEAQIASKYSSSGAGDADTAALKQQLDSLKAVCIDLLPPFLTVQRTTLFF